MDAVARTMGRLVAKSHPCGASERRHMAGRPWRTRRRLLAIAAAGALAAVGGGAWALTSSAAATPSYRVVSARLGVIRTEVSSTGTLAPAEQAALDFSVPGQVTAVRVTVGEHVTAGQTLATVDSAALAASVAQAQASLGADESRLSADTGSGASAAQLAADQAAVTAAQIQLTDDEAALAAADLTAPFAGTVAAVNLTVGEQVSGRRGGGGAGSATSAQVVLVNLSSWVVNTTVDDTQVGQIAAGDQADIIPAGSTTTVYGTVASVGLIGTDVAGVATYPVTIKVTGDPPGLYDGDSASVAIIVRQLDGVLTLPAAAVRYHGGHPYVVELAGGHLKEQQIRIGASSGGLVQVTGGLVAGTSVTEVVPRVRAPIGIPRSGAGARRGGAGRRRGGGGGRGAGGVGG